MVGLNTPLAVAAYFLAKRTHATATWLYCGSAADVQVHPLTYFNDEIDSAAASSGQVSHDFVSSYLRSPGKLDIEAVRPLQVDARGSVNASSIKSGDSLIPISGMASVPEILALAEKRVCYLPEHSIRSFPERVDFITAPPTDLASRPILIATELGLFRHEGAGELVAIMLWPGVDPKEVAERTGYPVRLASDADVIAEQPYLAALRDIDPEGTILLEVLSRAERLTFLRRLRALKHSERERSPT
jgi:glutaconate CoA-transferase subunit B